MSSSITINSNLASLNAQRRLGQSTSALQTSFTRLSSGLRINKASDDAAGLAISESLNVDARVFGQGIRNLNDGLSTLAVADAAVEELSSIVIRLQELAEQAANGTLGHEQRAALDEEAQTLKDEYFRIAQSTEFNGRYLLRGGFGRLSLQGGYGEEGAIASGLGGAVGTGRFGDRTSFALSSSYNDTAMADINGDGVLDMVTAGWTVAGGEATVFLGRGDGTFSESQTLATESSGSYAVSLGDLNGDGVLDLVTAGESSAGGTPGEATVFLGAGDGTFTKIQTLATESLRSNAVTLGDLNGDGVLDMVTAGDSGPGEATVFLGAGDGSLAYAISYNTEPTASFSVAVGDVNGDGVYDLVTAGQHNKGGMYNCDPWMSIRLGNGNGTFAEAKTYGGVGGAYSTVAITDFNNDGAMDLVLGIDAYGYWGGVGLCVGCGDGNFGELTLAEGPVRAVADLQVGDLDGDGINDLVTADFDIDTKSSISILLGSNGGSFDYRNRVDMGFGSSNRVTSVELGDLNSDGVLDIASAGGSGPGKNISAHLAQTQHGVSPLLRFELTTQANAKQALPLFQRKLEQLASQRGQIGAFQARVEVAINKMQVEKENYTAARSQITDADVAWESAKLVRNNILQQAGAAVLAQANQAPALALALLRP